MSYHDERMSGGDAASEIHNYELCQEERVWGLWRSVRLRNKQKIKEQIWGTALGIGFFFLGSIFGLFWGLFMPIVGSYICYSSKFTNYRTSRTAGIVGVAIAIGWIVYLWFM